MKILFLLLAILTIQSTFAQAREDKLYVFDKEWKPTDVKKAVYLLIVRPVKPKNYLWIYYNIYGPRIKQESFSDEQGNILNGHCIYYQRNGGIDSVGEYLNGESNGSFYFYSAEGRVTRQKDYEKGLLVKDTMFAVVNKDSIKSEPIPGEVESSFPGGAQGWMKFLGKNFTYPERAMNSSITGTVRVQFIVDKEGKVQDPEINKSVEYSLDEEALRILKKSPKWTPATKDGVILKSYKMQPITFLLTR